MRPSGVTRSDSRSRPRRPRASSRCSRLLITAASRRSNTRSMPHQRPSVSRTLYRLAAPRWHPMQRCVCKVDHEPARRRSEAESMLIGSTTPTRRNPRRSAHPVRTLLYRLRRRGQSGAADRRARGAGRALQSPRRAARRCDRRRRHQASQGLQPDARIGAVERSRSADSGPRRAARLRHQSRGCDPGRQQDRAGADRCRHRRRRR